MGVLLFFILLVLILLLLWPTKLMPGTLSTVAHSFRAWLRNYWDSQGG